MDSYATHDIPAMSMGLQQSEHQKYRMVTPERPRAARGQRGQMVTRELL